MAAVEKILISTLRSDAIWQRLRLKFKEFDVENDSEDDNVYDLYVHDDISEDEVFFWGRDGWANGWWHARIYLERSPAGLLVVYAERGENEDCMAISATRKKLLAFMESCLNAQEHGASVR